MGDEDELVVAGGEHGADDNVALGEVDADEAAIARAVGVVGDGALLDDAALRGHHKVAVFGKVLHADHCGDLFGLREAQETRHGLALGGPRALGHVVDFLCVALAGAREKEDIVVRARGEEVLDEVLLVGLGADDPLAAAPLAAVFRHRRALDEAEVGCGDDATLVGNDILHPELAHRADDLCATWLGVLLLQCKQFLLDDGEQLGLRFEDAAQLLDQLD